jgi:mono/diheme cytochrome c family protein
VPRPEWYFLPIYQLLKLVPGSAESLVAVGVPAALFLVMLALPFFDRSSARNLRRRPVALVSLVALLAGSGLLIGAAGRAPESSVSAAELALNATERAGRVLYHAQQCGNCHVIGDEGVAVGPDLTTVGLRHSAGWLHSFVEEPSRFRPGTPMPAFGPPTLSHQEIEELSQYLASLQGTSGATPQFADTFPQPPVP